MKFLRKLFMTGIEIACDDAYLELQSLIDSETNFFTLMDSRLTTIELFYDQYFSKVSDKFIDARYSRLRHAAYRRGREIMPKTCKN